MSGPGEGGGAAAEPSGAVPVRRILRGWGMATHARSWVYRPRTPEEAAEALADARRRELTLCHRGAGQSYGDAALNQGGAVLETTALDRILDLDADEGLARVEAGVTIHDLWRHVIARGWWPRVVPGTGAPTVGGCVAMDVHGKNHPVAGTFGDTVEALTVLGSDGELRRLSRTEDAGALGGVVGAQGLNGTILDVTLRLQRVRSGFLEVESRTASGLDEVFDRVERAVGEWEHVVAWIDCFATGSDLGRGVLHYGRPLPDDHRLAGKGLDPGAQALPRRVLGVVPSSVVPPILGLFMNRAGVRAVNLARRWAAAVRSPRRYVEPHAAFHFLLDRVPGWKGAYGPDGLIQYQLFAPAGSARHAFRQALLLQQRLGYESYLGVLKRHRPAPYSSTYALDGYSLALDFPVRAGSIDRLGALCRGLEGIREDVGGRLYPAKDAVGVGELPSEIDPFYGSNLVRRWSHDV